MIFCFICHIDLSVTARHMGGPGPPGPPGPGMGGPPGPGPRCCTAGRPAGRAGIRPASRRRLRSRPGYAEPAARPPYRGWSSNLAAAAGKQSLEIEERAENKKPWMPLVSIPLQSAKTGSATGFHVSFDAMLDTTLPGTLSITIHGTDCSETSQDHASLLGG